MRWHTALTGRPGRAPIVRSPWFFAALLLAMASALLPALMPSGGAGRTIGSAFDPTSNVLTLRVRDQTPRPAATRMDEGRRMPHPASSLTSVTGLLLAVSALTAPRTHADPALLRVLATWPRHGFAQPRAPPHP